MKTNLKSNLRNSDFDQVSKKLINSEKKKINIWLDPAPYKKLKLLALQNEETATSIINQLITDYVNRHE